MRPGSRHRVPRKSEKTLTRRTFIKGSGALLAGAGLSLGGGATLALLPGQERPAPGDAGKQAPAAIPRKVLGRTGVDVSILGLGTALLGHQNQNRPEIGKLVDVFGEAIDRGINYVDTARIYGGAEEALKKVLATRRDKVVLATKVWAEDYQQAEKLFHESLRQLGQESVEVLHLHSTGDKDIEKVLGKGGSWEFIQKAKRDGKARFIGITGHSKPSNFVRMLATGTVDVLMVALNFVDRHIYGFEEKVLPEARKHRTGILAMKVYGGVKGGFPNYSSRSPFPSQMGPEFHRRSIGYVKALEGVTGMVIGVHSREQLLDNIQRVIETESLSREEFRQLCEEGKALAPVWQARFGPVA